MKKILGVFVLLIALSLIALAVIVVWDIVPVAWDLVFKIGLSVLLFFVLVTIIMMIYNSFFKKSHYTDRGNRAHRKQDDLNINQ